jgi:1,4-dihydroxy-2-naphthoate octaprenyltransferase
LSLSIGLLSTAILVVNNVRDIDTDRRAGKNTLAVRLGRERTRRLYVALVAVAYLVLPLTLLVTDSEDSGRWWAMLAFLSIPLALRAAQPVLTRTDGPSLNGALARTGALLAAFSVLVSIGLLINA